MSIFKVYKYFIFASVFFVMGSFAPAFSQNMERVPVKKALLSLDLKEEPLKSVVEEIHKQTGFQVVYDEKWNDLPLSGQYKGVTLEAFFKRALRQQNVTVSYDEKGVAIALRFFGDKDKKTKQWSTGDSAGKDAPHAQAQKDSNSSVEQLNIELQEQLKDPETVDPVSGMKLGDIHEMQAANLAELERMRKDPEAVDPVSGVKLDDIQKMQDQVQKEPETIDQLSGMKYDEGSKNQTAQKVEMKKIEKKPEPADLK